MLSRDMSMSHVSANLRQSERQEVHSNIPDVLTGEVYETEMLLAFSAEAILSAKLCGTFFSCAEMLVLVLLEAFPPEP